MRIESSVRFIESFEEFLRADMSMRVETQKKEKQELSPYATHSVVASKVLNFATRR
jgi:hypothetical protein